VQVKFKKMRKVLFFFIFFSFLFSFFSYPKNKKDFQPFYAQIELKNGNTLEGEILKETDEYILLSILEGKGRTKIKKERITSIRRIKREPKKTLSTLKKESTQIENKIFSYKKEMKKIFTKGMRKTLPQIIIFILSGLFVFLSFLILIFKAPHRPLGVKLICFFEGIFLSLAFLYLLILSSFALNDVIYTLKGRFFYFIFVWALHLLLIISLFFLFHLRNWARRIYLICLGVFFIYNILCIAFQKEFLKEYSQAMIKKRHTQEIKSEKLISLPVKKEKFPWIEYLVRGGIYFLFFLYLLRPKTKKAFRRKIPVNKRKLVIITLTSLILFIIFDKTYQSFFIKLTGYPYLFIYPQKSKLKIEKFTPSQNLIRHEALGFHFFLPPDFEKSGKTYRSNFTVFFINKKKSEVFALFKESPYLYKWEVAAAHARYNPILLLVKAISTPSLGELKSIEKVILKDWEGLVWVFTRNQKIATSFFLKNKEGDYISGVFTKKAPLEKGKKEIFQLLSSIEKLK